MVPVGGAVVASPSDDIIDNIAKMYPGRASMSPILDLFITLLSMGEKGLQRVWNERLRLLPVLTQGLTELAHAYNEVVLSAPKNSISIGVSLNSGNADTERAVDGNSIPEASPSFLGSMLFQRNVSGCRVVPKSSKVTNINGYDFVGWGAHTTDYPHSYLTAACAVGATESDVVSFLERFSKVWKKVASRQRVVVSTEAVRDMDNDSVPDITSHAEDGETGN